MGGNSSQDGRGRLVVHSFLAGVRRGLTSVPFGRVPAARCFATGSLTRTGTHTQRGYERILALGLVGSALPYPAPALVA